MTQQNEMRMEKKEEANKERAQPSAKQIQSSDVIYGLLTIYTFRLNPSYRVRPTDDTKHARRCVRLQKEHLPIQQNVLPFDKIANRKLIQRLVGINAKNTCKRNFNNR